MTSWFKEILEEYDAYICASLYIYIEATYICLRALGLHHDSRRLSPKTQGLGTFTTDTDKHVNSQSIVSQTSKTNALKFFPLLFTTLKYIKT